MKFLHRAAVALAALVVSGLAAAAYPERHLCDVAIHLRGGATLAGRCVTMKGDPGNPHRPEEVERKFFDVTTPVWGAERARWLYDALMRLETIPDMREFSRDVVL